MNLLSKLSPAETLLILQDKNAPLKELLKLVFMDLLLKQIVKTTEVKKQKTSKEPIEIYKYVEKGRFFLSYKPLPHENVFLAPFQKSKTIQILFKNMIKMSYQNARSKNYFHNMIRQSPRLEKCFSRTFLQSIFGGFSMTVEGGEMRKKVEEEIAQLEKQLPELISNNQQKALDILKLIRGNIFFVPNIDLGFLKEIDKDLWAEIDKNDDDKISDFSEYWDIDHCLDAFDSGGDSGCGGSGCSGSGCSGGGCGGGGCGGGCGGG